MDKIIIIGIIFVMVTLIVASILFATIPPKLAEAPVISSMKIDASLFDKDESELNLFEYDISIFNRDSGLLTEADQAFNEILDVKETALDENSLSKEAASSDLAADLNATGNGEIILEEVNQALTDISK